MNQQLLPTRLDATFVHGAAVVPCTLNEERTGERPISPVPKPFARAVRSAKDTR